MGDLDIMKVIKTLESLGIDLRKIIKDKSLSRSNLPVNYTLFDLIPDIGDVLAKVDLTTDDLEEMCNDAGISQVDILMAYVYYRIVAPNRPFRRGKRRYGYCPLRSRFRYA